MQPWRYLPYSAEPVDWQLAAGDALVRGLPPPDSAPPPLPALRWYTITPAVLILGAGQKLAEFAPAACQRAGITLHKRSSGGTAVLAEPDQIMLDIALPQQHPLYRHDVTHSYRWLGEVWRDALVALGVPGDMITLLDVDAARADAQTLDPLLRRACYGGQSPFEVLVEGRKVIGLAQTRRRHGALLQTGIYTRWSAARLVQLFAMPDAERATLAAHLDARVAGLRDVLPLDMLHHSHEALFAQVRHTLDQVLRQRYGVVPVYSPWTPTEQAIRAEYRARYAAL